MDEQKAGLATDPARRVLAVAAPPPLGARSRMTLVAALIGLLAAGAQARAESLAPSAVDPYVARPRIVVLTDIANEPDDQMSLVRLLV